LRALGRNAEAIQSYDRAIEINPKDPVTHYDRGISLKSLGRYPEALSAYDSAISIDPKFAMAYYNKGIILAELGRHDEALLVSTKQSRSIRTMQ
jgi:tetratricopeptide (TPR) repeat protein